MSQSIRPATHDDLGRLAELMGYVQAIHAEAHPEIFKAVLVAAEVEGFFADLLAKPDHRILVHDHGRGPDGYIWYEVIDRPEGFARYQRVWGYIHHISVAPEARLGGIGRTLVAEARKQLKQLGLNQVGVDSWAFNTRASQFFASLGFAPLRQEAYATL